MIDGLDNGVEHLTTHTGDSFSISRTPKKPYKEVSNLEEDRVKGIQKGTIEKIKKRELSLEKRFDKDFFMAKEHSTLLYMYFLDFYLF